MHGRLLPPSPALKELTILIRHGHLSEVRQFLQAKPLLDWKKGDRRQSPLLIAIRTVFYSMVEELLQSGIGKDEMCCAMSQALDMGRLDIIQLLCRFGADPKAIPYSSAVRARDPLILHWLEDNGIDLVTNNPVAMAIKFNHRPALGTLKRCKERWPQLLDQANMALRHHANEGSMRWVCLLLWVGANPRTTVPMIDSRWQGEEDESALQDAVSGGHFAIVEKFGIEPAKDDLDRLLYASALSPNKQIVAKLLSLGANPCCSHEQRLVERCMCSLYWTLKDDYCRRYDHRSVVDALSLLADKGARWQPNGDFRYFRSALAQAQPAVAIETLGRLIDSKLITQSVFKDIMSAPRMREILSCGRPGAPRLRDYAGMSATRDRGKLRR